jgi:hypothetical protein
VVSLLGVMIGGILKVIDLDGLLLGQCTAGASAAMRAVVLALVSTAEIVCTIF